jgi:hypothetical protein
MPLHATRDAELSAWDLPEPLDPPAELRSRLALVGRLLRAEPPGATGPRLLWFNPDGTLGRLPLGPKPLTLGRSRTADLLLTAPDASRAHCQVGLDPATGEAWVEDLHSVAGTRVDGTPITTRTPLIDGDLLDLPGARVGYLAE